MREVAGSMPFLAPQPNPRQGESSSGFDRVGEWNGIDGGRFGSPSYGLMLEFEIRQGEEVNDVVLEQTEVIIGRRNEAREVHLDLTPDDLVSRVHARVWLDGNAVFIEDMGSRSGTRVNGVEISMPMELQPTNKVVLGNTQFTVRRPLPVRRRRGAPKNKDIEGTAIPGREKPEQATDGAVVDTPEPVKPDPVPEIPAQPPAARSSIHAAFLDDASAELVFSRDEIFIGRKHPESNISVDLSSDLQVSRKHARVWQTRGICWVEDLGSTHGTKVNGGLLNGACTIKPEDVVTIGSTDIRFWVVLPKPEVSSDEAEAEVPLTEGNPMSTTAFPEQDSYAVYKEDSYRYHPPGKRTLADLEEVFASRKSPMGRIRATHQLPLSTPFVESEASAQLIHSLPHLARQLDAQPDTQAMGDWFVKQLAGWLEGVKRAALFVVDDKLGRVRMISHVPALKPILSDTLAHRALETRTAFAWCQVSKEECVRRLSMHAGMYVPLIVGDREVGLLCVDETAEGGAFSDGQLSGLVVAGQILAVYLAQRGIPAKEAK